MDGECPLGPIPDCKGERERHGEEDRGRLERHTQIIDQVVRDQRADNADHHDRSPIGPGHVALLAKLKEYEDYEDCAHDP